MRLDKDAIEDLRARYHEEFAREISLDEADEIGNRLLHLMDLITRCPSDPRDSTAPSSRTILDPSR